MQIPMIDFRTIEPVTSILRRDLIHPAMPEIVDGWGVPPTAPGLGLELNVSNSNSTWTTSADSRSRLDRPDDGL